MMRIDLKDHTRLWGDMVVWCKQTLGEAQGWEPEVMEPLHLYPKYRWAIGKHADMTGKFSWPCFWIPDGADYTAFVLRWA